MRCIPYEPAFLTLFQEVQLAAFEQTTLLRGSPGSVITRRKAGKGYYYRQFYDLAGKKTDEYIGPVGTEAGEMAKEAMVGRIEIANRLIRNIRSLAREGFVCLDAMSGATLAALHNRRIFDAGAHLVGTHAYGALLNHLGVQSVSYTTHDIDIARDLPLDNGVGMIPEGGLLEILQESGIHFVEVPGLDRRTAAASWKPPGKDRLHVDLLVPSVDAQIRVVAVPELQAHAQALPYLRYLLAASLSSVVLSRDGAIPVRVPTPERFAIHKLVVSQLRDNLSAKVEKDAQQAAVLCAVLEDRYPGALADAAAALPVSARSRLGAGARQALKWLTPDYPRAADIVGDWAKRQ